jgi:hypothetical protein
MTQLGFRHAQERIQSVGAGRRLPVVHASMILMLGALRATSLVSPAHFARQSRGAADSVAVTTSRCLPTGPPRTAPSLGHAVPIGVEVASETGVDH